MTDNGSLYTNWVDSVRALLFFDLFSEGKVDIGTVAVYVPMAGEASMGIERDHQLPLFADLEQAETADKEPKVEAIRPCFESTLLALGSIKGVGHKTIKALVDLLKGDLGRVWEADASLVAEITARIPLASRFLNKINEIPNLRGEGTILLEKLREQSVSVLQSSWLPDRLRAIPDDPPKWLFVRGDAALLNQGPFVALVGTRKPSEKGLEAVLRVSKVLARYPQITVVSGLAEGIDGHAHSLTLERGLRNIAFLGHGLNYIFPVETKEVRERILEQGVQSLRSTCPTRSTNELTSSAATDCRPLWRTW